LFSFQGPNSDLEPASECRLPCLHLLNTFPGKSNSTTGEGSQQIPSALPALQEWLVNSFIFCSFFLLLLISFLLLSTFEGLNTLMGSKLILVSGVHGEVKVTRVEKVMLRALRESPLSIADCPQPILLQGFKFARIASTSHDRALARQGHWIASLPSFAMSSVKGSTKFLRVWSSVNSWFALPGMIFVLMQPVPPWLCPTCSHK